MLLSKNTFLTSVSVAWTYQKLGLINFPKWGSFLVSFLKSRTCSILSLVSTKCNLGHFTMLPIWLLEPTFKALRRVAGKSCAYYVGGKTLLYFPGNFRHFFIEINAKTRFLIGCINIPNFTFNASEARTFQTELPILHFIWYLSHFPTGKRAILALFRTYFSLGFWKSGLMFITLHYIGEAFISGQNVLSSIQLFKPGNIFF